VLSSYAASVTLSFTYGKTTPTAYFDPEIVTINKGAARFSRALKPGGYLVDTFPILHFVPGYLSQLKAWHQEEHVFFDGKLDVVRKHMVRGCFLVPDNLTQLEAP
jgi:hypothetical protein